MKNCPETIAPKTVNWRYRIANAMVIDASEIPTVSSSPVMNWRYRLPNVNYEVITTVKSTPEVNWRYKLPANSPYDLN